MKEYKDAPVAQEESAVTAEPTPVAQEESAVTAESAPVTQAESAVTAEPAPVAQEESAPAKKRKPKVLPTPPPVPETAEERKKLAAKYLIFAAITFACIYVVQIFHVFDSLFDRIYYGNLTTIFYYVLNLFAWIPMIVVLHKQCGKRTGFKLVRRAYGELSLKRSLLLYVCTVVPIFIVSASLGFTVKIVYELGKRVNGMQLISNASMYAHGAVKLILALIVLELVQEAIDLLYRGKFADKIPWGGIALCCTFGFAEVLVAALSGASLLFAWIYFAFDLLYGVIYLLAKRNFPAYYFISLILYIL